MYFIVVYYFTNFTTLQGRPSPLILSNLLIFYHNFESSFIFYRIQIIFHSIGNFHKCFTNIKYVFLNIITLKMYIYKDNIRKIAMKTIHWFIISILCFSLHHIQARLHHIPQINKFFKICFFYEYKLKGKKYTIYIRNFFRIPIWFLHK